MTSLLILIIITMKSQQQLFLIGYQYKNIYTDNAWQLN